MVKTAEKMEREVRDSMRGGSGEVEIVHIFKAEELGGKARLLARLRLGKGSSIGYHEHNDEEEVFYILRGQGVVSENGEEKTVAAGDAALTKGGNSHSIRNDSEEPLEVLAVILLYV